MKFLTKEVRLALTAIVAMILVFLGINFLKGINVFQATNSYYVQFRNINGLTISNPVFANGYPVGIVRTIEYDYSRTDNVIVGIELQDEMRMPQGTRAELVTELMGGVKMNLILEKNPTQFVEQGDTIQGGMHKGSLNKMEAMIPVVEQILPKLDSIMGNLNRVLADTALTTTLHNVATMSGELAETSKSLNRMMKKDVPALVANLKEVSDNVNKITADVAEADLSATIEQVNATLQKVKSFSKQLDDMGYTLNRKMNSKDNTLGLLLNDRSVFDNLNSTISHADSLMIDLKAHPKRYVHFSIFGRKDK